MSNQTVTQAVVVPSTVPNFNQGTTLLALYNPDGTPFEIPEMPVIPEMPEIPEPFVLVPAEAVDDYEIAGETLDPAVDLAGLIAQFNILLANLRAAGFLDSEEPVEE